jgi:hypothetical protein
MSLSISLKELKSFKYLTRPEKEDFTITQIENYVSYLEEKLGVQISYNVDGVELIK